MVTQEVVIYKGDSGHKALNPVARAVDWGFEHVYYFQSGLDGWEAAGYPVERSK